MKDSAPPLCTSPSLFSSLFTTRCCCCWAFSLALVVSHFGCIFYAVLSCLVFFHFRLIHAPWWEMPVRHQFSFKARCCDWAARHNNTRISGLVSNVDVKEVYRRKLTGPKVRGGLLTLIRQVAWVGKKIYRELTRGSKSVMKVRRLLAIKLPLTGQRHHSSSWCPRKAPR